MSSSVESSKSKSLGLPTKEQSRSLDDLRENLGDWLGARLDVAALRVTDIQVPSGSGLANETLMLEAEWRQSGETRRESFVVRIEASDPLFPGATAERQYLMNRALAACSEVPVPRMFGFEPDPTLLGAPFYLMERIVGRVPTDDPPYHHSGWVVESSEVERAGLFRDAVRVMASLHAVAADRFDFLNPNGLEDGLRASLEYYIDEFDPPGREKHRVIDAGRRWLLDNYPGSRGLSLAWGDARVGNMVFDRGCCRAVLDWDMVSLSGPETDLAWWCSFDQTYTVSAGIPRLRGIGTPREMVALWEGFAGREVRDFDWHLAFAFYKGAVIVRRLARMLKRAGNLPERSAYMEHNNSGVQYLASFLDLPSDYPIDSPWPGLD